MKPAVVLSFIVALVAVRPHEAREQLPKAINELYPVKFVLHELIADMNRLRAGMKRRLAAFQREEEKERGATADAGVQAWDEAIRLATKKIDRCP